MTKIRTKILLTCIGMALYPSLPAQQMYRCGNSYQDRPCEGQQNKIVAGISNNAAPQKSAASPVDSNCARRGIQAQKIKWAREAGRTEEMQLASAKTSGEKYLISDVYARGGTSSDVRAGVEADCMAEKEKAMAAGAPPNWQRQDERPLDADRAESSRDSALKQHSERSETTDRAKKFRCESIVSDIKNLRSRQRSGGDSTYMEELRQQQRDADSAAREAGC